MNCIAKQEACAAASSSSGLVIASVLVDARLPGHLELREARRVVVETILPSPSMKPPIHSTSAVRIVAIYAITSTRRSAGASRPS